MITYQCLNQLCYWSRHDNEQIFRGLCIKETRGEGGRSKQIFAAWEGEGVDRTGEKERTQDGRVRKGMMGKRLPGERGRERGDGRE